MKSTFARRFISLTSAGLLFGALVVGPASAEDPPVVPVVGTGTLSCRFVGKIRFLPSLVNGGIDTAATATIRAKAVKCSGTGDGANISSGRLDAVVALPSNDCVALSALTTTAIGATITWKTRGTAPALEPTTVSLTSLIQSVSASGKTVADTAGTATGGSFGGVSVSASMGISRSTNSLANACANGLLNSVNFSASRARINVG